MALVDLATGRTQSFRACSRYVAIDQPVTIARAQKGGPYVCPVHHVEACVETFYSASDLASMSWWRLLKLSRFWATRRVLNP